MNQSTAFDAGHLVGTVIAFVAIYGGILALGLYFARRLTAKRENGTAVHWPVGLALALILLLLIGQCSTSGETHVAPLGSEQADVVVEQRVYGPASTFSSRASGFGTAASTRSG